LSSDQYIYKFYSSLDRSPPAYFPTNAYTYTADVILLGLTVGDEDCPDVEECNECIKLAPEKASSCGWCFTTNKCIKSEQAGSCDYFTRNATRCPCSVKKGCLSCVRDRYQNCSWCDSTGSPGKCLDTHGDTSHCHTITRNPNYCFEKKKK